MPHLVVEERNPARSRSSILRAALTKAQCPTKLLPKGCILARCQRGGPAAEVGTVIMHVIETVAMPNPDVSRSQKITAPGFERLSAMSQKRFGELYPSVQKQLVRQSTAGKERAQEGLLWQVMDSVQRNSCSPPGSKESHPSSPHNGPWGKQSRQERPSISTLCGFAPWCEYC